MTILWINLAIVFTFAFLSRYFSTVEVSPNSSAIIKPNKIFIFGALLSLILVSGLRSNIGDTFFYQHSYKINTYTWELIKTQKDMGFGILQMILQKFSDDPQILLFSTALISNILIIIVLYNYSRMIEISTYVYITGGLFLVSMNGIRQVFAASIVFTATRFLLVGDWKKYLLTVLVASTFHESALILIPIYFLVRIRAWSKSTFISLIFSIVIVLGYNQFSTFLFSALKDSQYGHYKNFEEGGANIIRVLVNGAPLLVAYFGREKLRKIFVESDYIVNMSIIGFIFMVISTQNWIFARFSIYFDLYQLILISWLIKLFRDKDQKFVYIVLLLSYFLYYFYESVVSLNVVYKSDYF